VEFVGPSRHPFFCLGAPEEVPVFEGRACGLVGDCVGCLVWWVCLLMGDELVDLVATGVVLVRRYWIGTDVLVPFRWWPPVGGTGLLVGIGGGRSARWGCLLGLPVLLACGWEVAMGVVTLACGAVRCGGGVVGACGCLSVAFLVSRRLLLGLAVLLEYVWELAMGLVPVAWGAVWFGGGVVGACGWLSVTFLAALRLLLGLPVLLAYVW
jgi:hypothetical protein